jgi:hypothetical protein
MREQEFSGAPLRPGDCISLVYRNDPVRCGLNSGTTGRSIHVPLTRWLHWEVMIPHPHRYPLLPFPVRDGNSPLSPSKIHCSTGLFSLAVYVSQSFTLIREESFGNHLRRDRGEWAMYCTYRSALPLFRRYMINRIQPAA